MLQFGAAIAAGIGGLLAATAPHEAPKTQKDPHGIVASSPSDVLRGFSESNFRSLLANLRTRHELGDTGGKEEALRQMVDLYRGAQTTMPDEAARTSLVHAAYGEFHDTFDSSVPGESQERRSLWREFRQHLEGEEMS